MDPETKKRKNSHTELRINVPHVVTHRFTLDKKHSHPELEIKPVHGEPNLFFGTRKRTARQLGADNCQETER